jgi:peptide deformylase
MIKIVQKDKIKGEILRQIALPVNFAKEKEKIIEIINNMRQAMFAENDGVALAAPQIGISKRIFIINPIAYQHTGSKYVGPQKLTFINPKILKISKDRKLMEEGCLSVRPWYGKVRRSTRATIEAYDEKGEKFQISASGLLAQIFQHETDHLEGVLFSDKAKELYELQ